MSSFRTNVVWCGFLLDSLSSHLLISDVLDRGAEATSSRAGFSETLRTPRRKGLVNCSRFRRSRRRKLTPGRLGGQANTCPLSSVEKRVERYWEGSRLAHLPLFFSSLHSFFTGKTRTLARSVRAHFRFGE